MSSMFLSLPPPDLTRVSFKDLRVGEGLVVQIVAESPSTSDKVHEEVDRCSGLTVWECSLDLARFLTTLPFPFPLRALELGCGHAVPSLILLDLLPQGSRLHLQDLDPDTLKSTTQPNVWAKGPGLEVRYMACEWGEPMAKGLLEEVGPYDLILCSEGLYREETFDDLTQTILGLLSPGGTCYLSSKRFYFGVGGGSAPYLHWLGSRARGDVVWTSEDGQSNVRDIIKLNLL